MFDTFCFNKTTAVATMISDMYGADGEHFELRLKTYEL